MSHIKKLQNLNLTSGNISENWQKFKTNYDEFEIATGINLKSEDVRIATFLNAVGNEAADIFLTFQLSDQERKEYVSVIRAFETFCVTKRNQMFERYMFYNRNQKENESFEQFLSDIKRLIITCEFSAIEIDSMLRDRIVLGIADKKFQKKLINTDKLTSEQIIEQCKLAEISKLSQKMQIGFITYKERSQNLPREPPHDTAFFSTRRRFSTKIDDNATIMTMKEIKACMMEKLGLDTTYTQHPKSREYLLKYEPKREDLPTRNMKDSFTSAIIPLAKDSILRDSYATSTESIRFGRLMEDMDLFAVWVCHKHVYIPKLDPQIHLPYTFVTILVDKIKFTDVIPSIHNDIRISGHASWVGTSSIEVVVWLETVKPDGSLEKITKSLFLMGTRNAINTKAAPVNPLKADNEYEQEVLDGANERKKRRSAEREKSLLKVLPTQEEQKLMHDNFIITQPDTTIFSGERILPPNCAWMDETKIVDIDIAFPENRNAQNTIFGGFLMRKALENSIINASLYAGVIPRIKYISNISFHKPVNVNTILKMTTFVTYTEKKNIQIMCITETRTADTDFFVTNVFHYTYESDVDVPTVLPKTYQEGIWNLIGRREFRHSKDFFEL